MQPDYSRQTLLKEIGAQGQAALAHGRVLIVGAGGLGSPVLQYLAGAGVGYLGIVDADTLDASNLHRQPIFALANVGERKVELALAAVKRINPAVQVELHAMRLDADNALALIRGYDVVVDCSDNLQVYKPEPAHACLRCHWPDAVADGVVGNCAEAGVLGPVPGTLGTLQALLTIKILLGMSGQLDGELLLLDFTNFSSLKIKAPRRAECRAPDCAHIREIAREDPGIEIALRSLADAAQSGLEVIDIRTREEVTARPTAARHIAMPDLLADPGLLSPGREYLLVCASGKRSLAAARELRKQGFAVRSLAGGLQALEV